MGRDLDDHEAAEYRLPLGEITQPHRPGWIDDGRLLSPQTTAGDPHVRRLGLAKHSVSSFADIFQVVSEMVHRSVVE